MSITIIHSICFDSLYRHDHLCYVWNQIGWVCDQATLCTFSQPTTPHKQRIQTPKTRCRSQKQGKYKWLCIYLTIRYSIIVLHATAMTRNYIFVYATPQQFPVMRLTNKYHKTIYCRSRFLLVCFCHPLTLTVRMYFFLLSLSSFSFPIRFYTLFFARPFKFQ